MNIKEIAEKEVAEEQFREQVEVYKTELRKGRVQFKRLREFFALQGMAWLHLMKGENS